MKHRHYQSSLALIVAASLLGLSPQAMAKDLHVAYAGSMGTVMDLHLGPAFAKAHSVQYQGEGQGAYGLARLIAAHKLRTDVFVSITPGPIEVLIKAGLVKEA
ncbi:MAG: substrate-binding domain-containing protein, partial [Acidithiobacillus ferrooxidans]